MPTIHHTPTPVRQPREREQTTIVPQRFRVKAPGRVTRGLLYVLQCSKGCGRGPREGRRVWTERSEGRPGPSSPCVLRGFTPVGRSSRGHPSQFETLAVLAGDPKSVHPKSWWTTPQRLRCCRDRTPCRSGSPRSTVSLVRFGRDYGGHLRNATEGVPYRTEGVPYRTAHRADSPHHYHFPLTLLMHTDPKSRRQPTNGMHRSRAHMRVWRADCPRCAAQKAGRRSNRGPSRLAFMPFRVQSRQANCPRLRRRAKAADCGLSGFFVFSGISTSRAVVFMIPYST